MKVRQLKHYFQSGMAWNNWPHWNHDRLQAAIVTKPQPAFDMSQVKLEPGPGAKIFNLEAHRPVTAAEVEAFKQEFVVVKKSTGEVVATFDDLGGASELVEKHKRQKKAALEILPPNVNVTT